MKNHISRLTLRALGLAMIGVATWAGTVALTQQADRSVQSGVAGQSVTRLSDGRWLVIGGISADGPSTQIAIVRTNQGTPPQASIAASLSDARGWHTATTLPDGQILITGGLGPNEKVVTSAELFDPTTGIVRSLSWTGVARAHHSATLLRDGRVLIAGGTSADGHVNAVETFDLQTLEVHTLKGTLLGSRADHTATLLPNGSVQFEGGAGNERSAIEIYDPSLESSQVVRQPTSVTAVPAIAFMAPLNGDEVSATPRMAVQFTTPVAPTSLNGAAIRLQEENGSQVDARAVVAEGGRLLFVTPERKLSAGRRYRLTVTRLVDIFGSEMPTVSLTLKVKAEDPVVESADADEDWVPPPNRKWRTDRERSPWETLAPLRAAPGVTAVSGRILMLNGQPLSDVTLKIGSSRATSDRTGRFLLTNTPAGEQTLVIDGRSAARPGRTYGVFLARIDVRAGDTLVLPFTTWMPRIDVAHAVAISSPLASDLVVTTPLIPGLEVHIPKGSIVRDHDGRPVRQIGITPIPVDRPPFPLPAGVDVPVYFTIQPGGGFIELPNSPWPAGARVVYPNFTGHQPGTEFQFWNYDPENRGWHVYGQGDVNPAGGQVVPRAGVVIYRFTGTMINVPGMTPPADGPVPDGPRDGDPVDLATGLFVLEKTDLYLTDVMPLSLTRTYRQNDTSARPFGIGATHPYAMFLWSAQPYQEVDLVLPDGGRIHYVRTSAGTSYYDAVFEHSTSPGLFYKSQITWVNADLDWHLRLRDGTTYIFPAVAPLKAIRDRHGNTITIAHASGGTGNITRVTSPNGRYIDFTYDGSNRITQAKDNIGRTVGYQYDGSGRLWKVTDPASGVTEYTYDTSHRMLTIEDARGITFLTNQYDTNGRVIEQTQADSTTYEFAYTLDGSGRVTQNDVTDPRGTVTRWNFNTSKYPTSRIKAYGTGLARTTTWTRDSTTHRVTRVADGLSRNTDFTYDSLGNVASVTRLASTGNAVTTNYTYESTFSQLATVTDPLSHTTTFTRNSTGDVTTITDPLSHATTLTYNAAGQPLTLTTSAGTTSFAYDLGDLVTITDPLSQVSTRFYDSAGRLLRATNALGQITRHEYDALNAVTKAIDAIGSETTFTYDENRNLLTLTDARTNTTTYTYNNMDRIASRTDPLTNQETYTYDENGNLELITDRKGQDTTYTYDELDRQTQVLYDDSSTTDYTYDAGDRLTEIDDSIAGVIERDYDLLDRLTEEVTPEGTVTYTYDGADRRATMTVAGQTQISYGYDNADRLMSITQGTASVGFTYDNTDRRTVLTLPNGVTVETTYDNASQATALTYKLGGSTLGDLTYTYDPNGNRTAVGGSWTRTTLPTALTSATYNAGNQITAWGATSFTYDDNGNLTSDGSKTYTWNARNELTGLSGGASASFAYDGLGRRRAKTISSTTTGFLYDGLNAVQELSGGSPSANMLAGLGLDEWYRRVDSAATRDFLPDVLGSTVALSDTSGTVQTSYTYGAFGAMTTSGGSTTNRSGFTGREDDGTGLNYYRARYQHPTLQRFISEDPLEFAAGDSNLYAYVLNNPTAYTDPTGEFPWAAPLIGCLIGGGSSAAGDYMSGRKINWPAAAAGCAAGGFGGAGAGRAAAAAAGRGAGRGAAAAARASARSASKPSRAAKQTKPPPRGKPNSHEEGPRRSRDYGPDGEPVRDYDKPHQGNNRDHIHEWRDGGREHPGRDYSPYPRRE